MVEAGGAVALRTMRSGTLKEGRDSVGAVAGEARAVLLAAIAFTRAALVAMLVASACMKATEETTAEYTALLGEEKLQLECLDVAALNILSPFHKKEPV